MYQNEMFPVKIELSNFRRLSCHIKDFSFAVSSFHYSCKCCSISFFFLGGGGLKGILTSARRFSSLLPLHKLGSVANLILKCFAWHVCLE